LKIYEKREETPQRHELNAIEYWEAIEHAEYCEWQTIVEHVQKLTQEQQKVLGREIFALIQKQEEPFVRASPELLDYMGVPKQSKGRHDDFSRHQITSTRQVTLLSTAQIGEGLLRSKSISDAEIVERILVLLLPYLAEKQRTSVLERASEIVCDTEDLDIEPVQTRMIISLMPFMSYEQHIAMLSQLILKVHQGSLSLNERGIFELIASSLKFLSTEERAAFLRESLIAVHHLSANDTGFVLQELMPFLSLWEQYRLIIFTDSDIKKYGMFAKFLHSLTFEQQSDLAQRLLNFIRAERYNQEHIQLIPDQLPIGIEKMFYAYLSPVLRTFRIFHPSVPPASDIATAAVRS
jgi:hypothetical protein